MLKRIRHLLRDNPQLLWGVFVVGTVFLCCLIGMVYHYDPITARGQQVKPNLMPWYWYTYKSFTCLFSSVGICKQPELLPKLAATGYWLGTDDSGQSILIRLVEGTEAFFLPGMAASIVALIGGVLIGALSGYYGGWFELAGRYVTTVINSFPNLILVLLCTTVFGPSMMLIAGAVGVTFIPHIAEEIRRKVAQLKAEEFVMAAEAHGLRDRHVLFYHIVWLHCFPMIMRQLVFLWGYLIILETSLNYLGKGLLQKGNSWGKMLYDYGAGLFRGQYWSPMIVTIAVMITMSGFYYLAEGLQRWNDGAGRYVPDEDEQAQAPSGGAPALAQEAKEGT